MKIFIPSENDINETRVPLLPADCGKLVKLGADVEIEAGLARTVDIPDDAYKEVGVKISSNRKKSLSSAQIVLRINAPDGEDIQNLKRK